MEQNDSSSDSDERMKRRYGFEHSKDGQEHDDDDDDDDETETEKKSKSDKKTPSKSLFFGDKGKPGRESEEKSDIVESIEKQKQEAEQRRVLLQSILRQDESEKPENEHDGQDADSDVERTDDNLQATEEEGSIEDDETAQSVAETETQIEELEAEFEELVEDKIEKLQNEATENLDSEDSNSESTDPTAAELAADIGFLEKVSAKIKEGVEVPTAIEESVVESLEEAEENEDGVEASPEADSDDEGEETEINPEDENDDEPDESNVPLSSTLSSPVTSGVGVAPATTATNIGAVSSRKSAPAIVPPIASPTLNPSPLNPSPSNPWRPPAAIPPAMSPNIAPAYPAFNPNVLTTPSAPDTGNTVRMNDVYRRNRNTGKIILAGVIGYAIGRRGGRKRTEARMQPEINKGVKQINELEQKLEFSEQAVRQKAAESTRFKDELSEVTVQKNEAETARERTSEQMERNAVMGSNENTANVANNVETVHSKAEALTPLQAQILSEQQIVRSPSEMLADAITPPSSEVSLGKELLRAPIFAAAVAAEALVGGKSDNIEPATVEAQSVLTGDRDPALDTPNIPISNVAEAPPQRLSNLELQKQSDDLRRKKALEQSAVEAPKHIDAQTMTMPELLSVAEKIDVGSGNLKDMYEHKRIDAVNLRRVITEYSEGRNYKETLQRSLEAEEMHRELRNEVKTDNTGIYDSKSDGALHVPLPATVVASNQEQQDPSRPLDIPPPSSSFVPFAQPGNSSSTQQSSDQPISTSSTFVIPPAVVVGLGVLVGGIIAAIIMMITGIV